jgi:hypothetical protein
VGLGADVADAERQAGLGAFERLALAPLVAAQEQVRQVEIKTDHISERGLELRIAGNLVGPHQMRFDVVVTRAATRATRLS